MESPGLSESVVVGVWERQALDPAILLNCGLRVLFRGLPSDAGGPDYQEAVLCWDERKTARGDIEFHVYSSDWYRHGHHRDPRYNDVILHAVWYDDANETRREDGAKVPVLELRLCTSNSALTSEPYQLMQHPCVAHMACLSTEELFVALMQAAKTRFARRTEHFQIEIEELGPDQAAYAALLEGLGYASNRETFRLLSDVVPYGWLQTVPLEERAAVLLSAARLAPEGGTPPLAHVPEQAWRLSRLRPGNHPSKRLRGILLVLEQLGPNLADSVCELVSGTHRPVDVRRRLTAQASGETYIGPGRADELAVSVVFPFAAALHGMEDRAWNLFERYRSPPPNRWTRLMIGLLAHSGHEYRVRTAIEHQGLHHLYHVHCRGERRPGCPVCGSDYQATAGSSASISYQSRPILSSTSSGTSS